MRESPSRNSKTGGRGEAVAVAVARRISSHQERNLELTTERQAGRVSGLCRRRDRIRGRRGLVGCGVVGSFEQVSIGCAGGLRGGVWIVDWWALERLQILSKEPLARLARPRLGLPSMSTLPKIATGIYGKLPYYAVPIGWHYTAGSYVRRRCGMSTIRRFGCLTYVKCRYSDSILPVVGVLRWKVGEGEKGLLPSRLRYSLEFPMAFRRDVQVAYFE